MEHTDYHKNKPDYKHVIRKPVLTNERVDVARLIKIEHRLNKLENAITELKSMLKSRQPPLPEGRVLQFTSSTIQ